MLLVFAYIVRCDDDQTQKHLWQEEKKIVFSRRPGDAYFQFDLQSSELPRSVYEKIFAFDSMEAVDFLEYAHEKLLAIARDRTDKRWNWLGRFAASLPDSASSRSLRSALTRTAPPAKPHP